MLQKFVYIVENNYCVHFCDTFSTFMGVLDKSCNF